MPSGASWGMLGVEEVSLSTQTQSVAYPFDLPPDEGGEHLGLAVVWCFQEPHRLGEVGLVPPGQERVLGRGEEHDAPLRWVRQRPGVTTPSSPLGLRGVSRQQVVLRAVSDEGLEVRNVGRCALRRQGFLVDEATTVSPGEVLTLENQLVLLVVRRPPTLPEPAGELSHHPFGEADGSGIVGESPAAWSVREQVAFIANSDVHALIHGPSGTGKELAAQAIHDRSRRGARPMVSHNAAAIPESLVDAELFGHARDYPNAGMPERPGLIGAADRSTLFLDEIGELPVSMQAHLLRVLDGGEYRRLGETRARRSDFRLVAATNRDLDQLKHDVLARFTSRLHLPGLGERREDVPLLVRHAFRNLARTEPAIAERFCVQARDAVEPRITPRLMEALVRHGWTTHVRELNGILWRAMQLSRADFLDLHPDLELDPEEGAAPWTEAPTDPTEVSREALEAALRQHDGVREKVWRELGLKNRYVLNRLLKKYDLS